MHDCYASVEDFGSLNMMLENEVVALMKSSRSEDEWNANTDKVKAECNGYPAFWYKAVVMSGLMGQVAATWGGSDRIDISYR